MRRTIETMWGEVSVLQFGDAPTVIAVHGWMDNANSFIPMSDRIDASLVAIDLPGHGFSGHLADYPVAQWAPIFDAIVNALSLQEPLRLIGHSMGGSIALSYAALFPERVHSVVALDALGPLSTEVDGWRENLRAAIEGRREIRANRISKSFDALARARVAGLPYLTKELATLLTEGASEEIDGGWRFTHDPLLKAKSFLRLTEAHVLDLLSAVECPVLLVRPDDGFPVDEDLMRRRFACFTRGEIANVPGHHHAHMSHPAEAAAAITAFWDKHQI